MEGWYVTVGKHLSLIYLQPDKSEKEPIRALYQQYKLVKSLLEQQQEVESMPLEPKPSFRKALTADTPIPIKRWEDGSQQMVPSTTKSIPSTQQHYATYDSLKAEKKRLQVFLHEFQKDFMEKHGRKVQSREDRFTVQAEYDRYKVRET
jgi:hypothetical protein